jgi:hypothetical protein
MKKGNGSGNEAEGLNVLIAEQYYKIADLQAENARLKDLLENFSIGRFIEEDKIPAEFYYVDAYGVNGGDCKDCGDARRENDNSHGKDNFHGKGKNNNCEGNNYDYSDCGKRKNNEDNSLGNCGEGDNYDYANYDKSKDDEDNGSDDCGERKSGEDNNCDDDRDDELRAIRDRYLSRSVKSRSRRS